MNVLDVSSVVEATNTSVNVDKNCLKMSTENFENLYKVHSCPYFWLLYYHVKEAIENKVKEMTQEVLIHYFWISKDGIIKIKKSAGLTQCHVTHENDLVLEHPLRLCDMWENMPLFLLFCLFVCCYFCRVVGKTSVLLKITTLWLHITTCVNTHLFTARFKTERQIDKDAPAIWGRHFILWQWQIDCFVSNLYLVTN